MANNSSASGVKIRYDLYDSLPQQLRTFLQNSAFNWASAKVYERLFQTQSTIKTLRSYRSKEAHRIRRDARLVWQRDE